MSVSIVTLLLVLDKIIEVVVKLVVENRAGTIRNSNRKKRRSGGCIGVGEENTTRVVGVIGKKMVVSS